MSALRACVRAVALFVLPPLKRLAGERDWLRQELERQQVETERLKTEVARLQSHTFSPVKPAACVADSAAAPRSIAETLQETHVCLVKNALDPTRAATIRELAERQMASTWGGNYTTLFCAPRADGLLEVDPSVLLQVLSSGGLEIAQEYFDLKCGTREVVLPVMSLVCRKYDPTFSGNDDIKIPYHQDAFGFPKGFEVLNFWTLMSPDECGTKAPGLEFILDSFRVMLDMEKNPTAPQYHFLETSYSEIARYESVYDPWQPSIALGDIIVFTGLALHRTYLSGSQTATRYSAEIRLVGGTDAVLDHITRSSAPHYRIVGRSLRGPRVVRSTPSGPEVIETGEWPVASHRASR